VVPHAFAAALRAEFTQVYATDYGSRIEPASEREAPAHVSRARMTTSHGARPA
jgi:hypothetical protein